MLIEEITSLKYFKTNFQTFIICLSLIICLFIVSDAYLSPLKIRTEFIMDLENYSSYSKFGKSQDKTFVVKTKEKKYVVPGSLYNEIEDKDSIVIHSSALTGSIQKLDLKRNNNLISYQAGFIRSQWGLFMTSLLMIGLISFYFFSKNIKEEYTRRNLLIFLCLAPYALLLFHFDVNFYLK
ncbi:hypothetical protein [Pedobacter punctiformis]|uniref:Uncharacterized protein n=1 Tax=Pedobacter punctiformis TaxID=3004097 RepID=A0ABT4L3H0_9SPHI|nr:hypothetical protein [Pedobacter sp. HCMS5-2]MCZ4242467.1 hypothetical protein [Pedobacter sp. HCMS5-2]